MHTARTTVKIANGASQSGEIPLPDQDIIGLIVHGAWTSAGITFLAAERDDAPGNNPAFVPIYDDAGTELTVASAAVAIDRYIALRPDVAPLTRGPWRIKLRSGTAATPVNQAAERTITVVLGTVN